MIGTRLGPYENTAKLGEGGTGEKWRATDPRLKRDHPNHARASETD